MAAVRGGAHGAQDVRDFHAFLIHSGLRRQGAREGGTRPPHAQVRTFLLMTDIRASARCADFGNQRPEQHTDLEGLEHTVRVMLDALNDLIIIQSLFRREFVETQATLTDVKARTRLIAGPDRRARQRLGKPEEPEFGTEPAEREALEYLTEYVRGWRVGQRYLSLSRLTDHMRFKEYVDRKGRPFTQSQVVTLVNEQTL